MTRQESAPIIVHVVQQPVRSTTVGDVLIGSIGLAAVLVLAAVLAGGVLGGLLILFKAWRNRVHDAGTPDSGTIHIV